MTNKAWRWAVFIAAWRLTWPAVSRRSGGDDPKAAVHAVRAVYRSAGRRLEQRRPGRVPDRLLELAQGRVHVRRATVRRLRGNARSLPPPLQGRGQGDGPARCSRSSTSRPLGPESVIARGRFRLTMPDGTKPTGLSR